LIDSTAKECGTDATALKQFLEVVCEYEDRIHLSADIWQDLMEKNLELAVLSSHLNTRLKKLSLTKVKRDTAQTKLQELNEQMMKQKEALKMAETAKNQASEGFNQALALRNKPTKNSKVKAKLNSKWPAEIQVYEEQRSVLQSILNERLSHE
jgi:hypothetical protein